MKVAIDKQAGKQVAGVNAGAGEAIGGYRRGAAEARSGVEKKLSARAWGKQTNLRTQVDAAGRIRGAASKPLSCVKQLRSVAQVGREISREVGQGMRYEF